MVHPLRSRVAPMVMLMILGFSASAFASHYYVSDIEGVFSDQELAVFARFEVEDTAQLLAWMAPLDRRIAFQSMSGLDDAEILSLALFCDLLQVEGVGPSAAQLLIASGVTGAADLAAREPASLLAEVENVNMAEMLTDTTPTMSHVQAWIAAAQVVPVVVQY